jgi:TolB-like protein/Flp pilus assembly protein TadD
MDYLGEGMSEEITNSLSRLPNLTVMAQSTVSRYKSRQEDPQGVGRDLHVDSVLTGRVAEHGSDLTVEAELVDVATGAQLWGQRYTRKANDASMLQAAITSDLAGKLTPQITRNERDKVARASTRDADAYQLYLKGRYHASKSTAEGLKRGIAYFQQAIEKDPSDALAYAGLADAYVRLGGGFGYALASDVFPKAEAAAIKALEIDDTLVEAHAAFGAVKALYKWDWTGSEREFKRAIALDPRNAHAHNRYAQLLTWTGRFDEGITENKRAQDLDPLSPMIAGDLGYEYMVARRYDDSILQCKKAIDLEPSAMWLHAMLAWAYARKGNYAQAIYEHEKMVPQGHEVSAENVLGVFSDSELMRHRWARRINIALPVSIAIFMASTVLWLPAVTKDGDRLNAAPASCSSLGAVQERWQTVEVGVREYLARLTEHGLVVPLTYINVRGETWTYPLWQTLFHVGCPNRLSSGSPAKGKELVERILNRQPFET